MDTAYTSSLPSNPGTHLGISVNLFLRPISLHLETGPEPHTEDAESSVTLAKRPWQGNATPPSTYPQTFALIKIDLGPCCLLIPCNRHLHSLYVQTVRYKDSDIISVGGYLCRKRNAAQSRTCLPISKPTEQGLQSEVIEKRRQGGQPTRMNSRSRKLPSASNSPARLPAGCGISC